MPLVAKERCEGLVLVKRTTAMQFLLFVLLHLPLASTQAIYYIRPTSMSESPCLNGNCLTLSEYATNASKYSYSENLSLVFLQGEHTLNTSIIFQVLDTLVLQGNLSSLPNVTSKIVCDKTATFNLINISNVEISALAFVSCGGQHTVGSHAIPNNSKILEMTGYVAPGMFGLSISNLHFVSCNIEHNHLSLFFSKCTVYLHNSKFVHNKGVFGGAIAAHDSMVVFVGYNHFCNNSASEAGGGVFAQSSVLILRGSGAYIGNSAAKHGGGIAVINSSIHFTRDQDDGARVLAGFDKRVGKSYIFAQNSASLFGGGIALNNSTLNAKGGNLNFSENLAKVRGGIGSDSSCTLLDDLVVFESNSAVMGGAIAVRIGTWNSTAIRFRNNLAEFGGAIYSSGSRLDFGSVVQMPTRMCQHQQSVTDCFYHSIFKNNTANNGGAIQVYDSTVHFIGNHYFKHNIANHGGGINADLSSVYFNHISGNMTQELGSISRDRGYGIGLFEQNMAYADGGSLLLLQSTLKQSRGVLNFTENFANNDGGGLHCQYSFVLFHGRVIFESNSASGGGAVFIHFSIWNSSTIVFESNIAGHQGGAIHSDRSKLIFGLNVHEHNVHVLSQRSTFLPLNEVQNIFINNSASYGGALRVNNNCTIEFKGMSLFDSNSAKHHGGSISTTRSNIHFSGHQTNFTGNSAQKFGGGIDAATSALIFSEETTFIGNKAQKNGGGIHLKLKSFLNISGDGEYIDNVAGICGGAISAIDRDVLVFDGKSTFVMNSATFGGAVSVVEGKISFTRTTHFARNWATNGGAVFAESAYLLLSGTHSYVSNVAKYSGHGEKGGYGGVIHALRSKVTLNGRHSFVNNSARYGGGLAITDYNQDHFLYFAPMITVNFSDNFARANGGAMHIIDDPFTYCASDVDSVSPSRTCFFRFSNETKEVTELVSFPDVFVPYLQDCIGQITFNNNLAEQGGSIIYGGALETCRVEFNTLKSHYYFGHTYMSGLEAVAVVAWTSIEEITANPLNIASDAFKVCICDDLMETANCTERTINLTAFPGETVSLPVVAVGQVNGMVPAVMHAKFSHPEQAWLAQLQNTQNVNLSCSFLTYTLYSNGFKSTDLSLSVEGPCGDSGIPLTMFVNFLPCPDGFALSQLGSCECALRLQKYTNSCNINDRTISRSGEFWVGFDNQSHDLILHPHCPFDYCTLEAVSFSLNSTDLQCANNRSGTLCGACKPGCSLNLGSKQCSPCSSIFLLLFLPFAVAGFLLVLLLLICRVTVAAGTISGLIFYGNMVAVNRSVFFPSGETNVLTVFVAWINLDLGIRICFFNGMDTYTQTWLQFVFPLYIWLLVGAITLVSYYSTTIARIIGPTNPVSVLATLFLLSYTKLLRTIIATFSFTTLAYPNERTVVVWAHDGNIGYLEGKHIGLFLAGLLAFLLLFLPYTLLLLFGQCIVARSNHKMLSWSNNPKVRSFLDAYHAPYKDQHRYWAGLLLLLRFFLFIISAVVDINSPRDPSVNLLVLGIACASLLTLALNTGSMYRKWFNNILESSFILNLAILALASYQVKVEGGSQTAAVYTSVSVAFATFTGIIIYHVTERIVESRTWRTHARPTLQHFWDSSTRRKNRQGTTEIMSPPTATPPLVTTTFIELRESLLESQN